MATTPHLYLGSELCGTTAGDARAFEDLLKSLITQTQIKVNEKYVASYDIPNRANYWLTSNRPSALHLTKDARRFFVVHTWPRRKAAAGILHSFLKWRGKDYDPKSPGLSALLHKLLHVDLTGFDPGANAPVTADMLEMAANDRSDLQDWCHELHEDSQAVLARQRWSAVIAKNRFATTEQLMRAYMERTPNARIHQKQLTQELSEAGFVQANHAKVIRTGDRDHDSRTRFWIIRDFKNAAKLTPKQISDEWVRGGR